MKSVLCDHCDHTTKTEKGIKLHKGKKHDIPQGDANDTLRDEPGDNSERESEPVANSTMIKSKKQKM